MRRRLIYSDLDATFLDPRTNSPAESLPALRAALAAGAAVVFCSSKTGEEMGHLLRHLGLSLPFVSENGGGIHIPAGFFAAEPAGAVRGDDGRLIALGEPYERLVRALREVRAELDLPLRGFSDMTVAEVAAAGGLEPEQASRAMRRSFDEPFLPSGVSDADLPAIVCAFASRGLRVTRGGRFFHLTGKADKGSAVLWLNGLFQKAGDGILTMGIGDSANDIPMLLEVDHPVLVQKPGGIHDPDVCAAVPRLEKAGGIGPAGWAMAVTEFLGLA